MHGDLNNASSVINPDEQTPFEVREFILTGLLSYGD